MCVIKFLSVVSRSSSRFRFPKLFPTHLPRAFVPTAQIEAKRGEAADEMNHLLRLRLRAPCLGFFLMGLEKENRTAVRWFLEHFSIDCTRQP